MRGEDFRKKTAASDVMNEAMGSARKGVTDEFDAETTQTIQLMVAILSTRHRLYPLNG